MHVLCVNVVRRRPHSHAIQLPGASGGLRFYDLSDATSPRITAVLEGFTKPSKLTAAGSILCCCDGDNGIAVVDMADPTAPQVLGRFAAGAHSLHFDGRYLYAALQKLIVYHVSSP